MAGQLTVTLVLLSKWGSVDAKFFDLSILFKNTILTMVLCGLGLATDVSSLSLNLITSFRMDISLNHVYICKPCK